MAYTDMAFGLLLYTFFFIVHFFEVGISNHLLYGFSDFSSVLTFETYSISFQFLHKEPQQIKMILVMVSQIVSCQRTQKVQRRIQ